MKNTIRYFITDVVSIPIYRIAQKSEAYKMATKAGWGVVEWYSAKNNYQMPVNHDRSDKTQELICIGDVSAVLYPKYGQPYFMYEGDEFIAKKAPTQAETNAIIINTCSGYNIWAKDIADIKIFVTYDENGLIDDYRLEYRDEKPYSGEIEITFDDLFLSSV